MSKCNTCKNPISLSSVRCEWCGAAVVFERELSSNSNSGLTDFLRILSDIDNEIIAENGKTGSWGALDGLLSKAFGNSKIEALNQKKISIIKTYPLPKTTHELIEIASMAVLNFKSIKVHKVALSDNARSENKLNQPLKDAWRTRGEQALNMLSLHARTDDFVRQQVELFQSQMNEDTKKWFK